MRNWSWSMPMTCALSNWFSSLDNKKKLAIHSLTIYDSNEVDIALHLCSFQSTVEENVSFASL